ncbi:MAG: WG repeat-containing protein [Cyclobacteriaceae bacterium]
MKILSAFIFTIFTTLVIAQTENKLLDLDNLPEGYMVWRSEYGTNRVWTGEQYLFVNNDGKTIMELPQYSYVDDFRDGIAIVKTNFNKCGYLNLEGRIVIHPKFLECGGSNAGFVTVKDRYEDLYLLSNTGQQISLPLKEATTIQGTAIVVDKNDVELYIDLSKVNFDYYHPLMKAILKVNDQNVRHEVELEAKQILFLEEGSDRVLYQLEVALN